MKKFTEKEFAELFDNTNLKAFASHEDIESLCHESRENGFKTVAVNTVQVALAKKCLAGSNVGITGVIGFPLGQITIDNKVAEAKTVLAAGATDVDYVINITELKAKNYGYIKDEMKAIVDVCHSANAITKVIFENAYLTDDEKKVMCEIALDVNIDYVKTSTGFAPSGATLEDVRLMKSIVKDDVKIKAAGGIRSLVDVLAFVEAGASRIGTSSGKQLLKEYKEYQQNCNVPDLPHCEGF